MDWVDRKELNLCDLNRKMIFKIYSNPNVFDTVDDWDDCELKKLGKIVEKWNNEHRYQVVFRTPPVSDFEIWKANSYVSFQSKANGQQDRSFR